MGVLPSFYQGFFLAPTVAAGALKGAVFAANVFEKLGYDVIPNGTEPRYDIIQAVTLKKPEALIAFCQGIQAAAPVDSYVTPEPWDMPGYDSQVIMAAGAFIQGSSIELSADGPLKEPYAVYFQGGLTWYHAKYGIMMALEKGVESGVYQDKTTQPGDYKFVDLNGDGQITDAEDYVDHFRNGKGHASEVDRGGIVIHKGDDGHNGDDEVNRAFFVIAPRGFGCIIEVAAQHDADEQDRVDHILGAKRQEQYASDQETDDDHEADAAQFSAGEAAVYGKFSAVIARQKGKWML